MEKNNSEYISLKQIILTIQEYAKAILNAWKLVIVVALIFAVLFSIRNHYDDDRYTAKLSYMLEDNEGANPASLTGLLGSFGFGSSKGLNRDKLVELSKSDLIISQTLLDKVVINGSTDFLGNHMVSIYGYDEVWAKKETNPLKDFRFRSDVLEDFGLNEHRALKQLKSRIIGSPSMGIEGVLTSGYGRRWGRRCRCRRTRRHRDRRQRTGRAGSERLHPRSERSDGPDHGRHLGLADRRGLRDLGGGRRGHQR